MNREIGRTISNCNLFVLMMIGIWIAGIASCPAVFEWTVHFAVEIEREQKI